MTNSGEKGADRKKPLWVIIVSVVAVLVLPPIVVPVFIPWTGINCEQQDINIKTGQARYCRYIWFMKVSETVKDTPLSTALQGEVVNAADIKAWNPVNTFSPGTRNSPHYRFHGALSQAHQVEMAFALLDATPERKREIARTVLTLWQKTGKYFEVNRYLVDLTAEIPPNGQRERPR